MTEDTDTRAAEHYEHPANRAPATPARPPRPPRPRQPMRHMPVRFSADLAAAVERLAAEQHITASAFVRAAVERAVSEADAARGEHVIHAEVPADGAAITIHVSQRAT